MSDFTTVAKEFLAQRRIAVVGVSRSGQHTGNSIYKTLQSEGYEVFPVNPGTDEIDGERCYRSVSAIPDGVDGVLIVTNAKDTTDVVRDCIAAGVTRVWMHYNPLFGKGMSSVSEEAVQLCKDNGITVIDGACPMMFIDVPHKCMRWILGVAGKLPTPV